MAKKNNKKNGRVFSITAPSASSVFLVGDFTEWQRRPIEMQKQNSGQWSASVSLSPGKHEYRFLVDGQWQDDPACEAREENAFGTQNCVCQAG